MGLLTLLKKLKRLEKENRILILGLDNAGKTTIVAKYFKFLSLGFLVNLSMRYLQRSDLILLL
jgi:signal recognition particle GTPase